ncbi:MAG: WbqC family protein [Lachnospiraceae bacterium]|nr:WbqC family protein [Lachnospiraceae bacterium]
MVKEDIRFKKKIGIMQPYFFPYIGYWQLMNAVDQYVVYDDVNYINRGWINRNKILINGEPKYYNLPLLGASQNKLINEVNVNLNEREIKKNLYIIRENYKKAPSYNKIYPLLEEVFSCKSNVLSEYLLNSINIVREYLDIKTEIIMSSNINKDNSLRGENKILDICEKLKATEYYNAIGGKTLYHADLFACRNIKLYFLETKSLRYCQFGEEFYENLSIIDVLMFNEREKVIELLKEYTLYIE